MLDGRLHALRLHAHDVLIRSLSRQIRVAAEAEEIDKNVLARDVEGTHPSQLRPAAGARIMFLKCTEKTSRWLKT